MANIALNRLPLEPMSGSEQITSGSITGYTNHSGFGFFVWPGTITLDLDSSRTICAVRFLLWDGMGHSENPRDPRIYKYRLLTSNDLDSWFVIHDTEEMGYNGWQVFTFPDGFKARYVRIHGVYNSANHHFHLVELEVHDSSPPKLSVDATLEKVVDGHLGIDCGKRVDLSIATRSATSVMTEVGDGFSFSTRVSNTIRGLEEFAESNNLLNPALLSGLIAELKVQVRDVTAIEKSMDSIRREIMAPVKRELERASKFSRLGFVIGLLGGVMAVVSIVVNLIW